jgi:hypothetical protein
MRARTTRLAGAGAALALVAAHARAADPQPEMLDQEPPAEDRAPLDITGRLRASRSGLSLEIGGALVELRISGDQLSASEPSGSPGAHDFRATFSVDGKTTNLLLRIVPPPGSETPAVPK